MARTQQFTNKEIISALEKCKGAVYLAAETIGCHPDTIYTRAKKSDDIAQAITRHRGKMLDTAELALYAAITRGESWAVAFALKSIGRERGYGDRLDVMYGIDHKLLEKLKQQADASGVDLASVFESMIQEFAHVDRTGNREE